MAVRSPHPSPPWSRRTEGILAVGFWLILGVLTVVRRAVQPWRSEGLPAGDVIVTLSEYGLWALLTPLVFWLARRYQIERDGWARRLASHLAVGVAVAVVMEFVTRGVLRPLLIPDLAGDRPPWTLGGALFQLWFLDELIVYVAVLAAGFARDALLRLRARQAEADRLLADRARLEAQLVEARLSALQTQLNPHFLFNTLNAVSALVERDPAGVRTMIARLSSLLRRVLESDGAQLVPLREEVAFLRDYLDVQRVRFQGRLEVEEAFAPGTLDALVPPLLLQPLVENAVGHGVSRIEEGGGVIRLAARRDGDWLVLTVEDNGPGLDAATDRTDARTGVGLPNTRARLDALYDEAGALTLTPGAEGGVVAEVSLPFRTAAGSDGADVPLPHPTASRA